MVKPLRCIFRVDHSSIKTKLILLLIVANASVLFAQDISFSNFSGSPLLINPSNTGYFKGDWRVAVNYRNQWAAIGNPFTAATVSFDKQIYILNQNFNAGVLLVNNQSGNASLAYNKFYGSFGYAGRLRKSYVRFALQGGMAFGAVGGKVFLPSDHVPGEGFTTPSGFDETTKYLDINAGFNWKRKIAIFEPEIGLGATHLNNPNYSFYDNEARLTQQLNGVILLRTNVSDAFYFTPTFLYTHYNQVDFTLAGVGIGYKLLGGRSSVKRFYGGAYMRNGIVNDFNDIAVSVGSTIGRIDVTLTYDVGAGDYASNAGNSLGAFEVSIAYRSISTVLNSYSIPCERF